LAELKLKPEYSAQSSSASSPDPQNQIEQEISELNQYKDLLVKASDEGTDFEGLRVQLNSIAAVLEAKSQNLAAVRRKEQERR
jgi:hypothetical protein